jgi:uncharacterized cupredoxin-like copper-binding protein
MTDVPPPREQAGRLDKGSPSGTPRWVKVFAIVGVIFVVLVVLMLTGVLGEGHGPGRHMGGGGGSTQVSERAGGPADPGEASRTVRLSALDTMAFQPAAISVSAGEIITFEVTNAGKAVHEFTLGDAQMQQQHADAMAHMPAGVHHAFPNSITLQPGETKTLTWRFGNARTVEFACHEPGHYQAGMRGRVTTV